MRKRTVSLAILHPNVHTGTYHRLECKCVSQAAVGTLIGEDGLVVMAGEESMEWYQIHQIYFHVIDTIPFTPFQTL